MLGIGKRKANEAFQITIHDSAQALRLKMAGALAAGDVCNVESCWRTAASTIAGRRLVVDLTALASVDAEGRGLLARMYAEHAELVGATQELNAIVGVITGSPPTPPARMPIVCCAPGFPGGAASTEPTPSCVKPGVPLAERIAMGAFVLGLLACLVALASTTGMTVDEPFHFLSGR